MNKIKEFEELPSGEFYRYHVCGNENKSFKETIELAQKDAWNAAIKFAAKNAKTIDNGTISIVSIDVDRQSILNGLIND